MSYLTGGSLHIGEYIDFGDHELVFEHKSEGRVGDIHWYSCAACKMEISLNIINDMGHRVRVYGVDSTHISSFRDGIVRIKLGCKEEVMKRACL